MWWRRENTEISYCFAADLFGGAREEEEGREREREIKVVKIASLKQLPGQHSKQGNQNSVFVCKRSRYRQCQDDSGTDSVDVFLPPTSWRQQLLNQP